MAVVLLKELPQPERLNLVMRAVLPTKEVALPMEKTRRLEPNRRWHLRMALAMRVLPGPKPRMIKGGRRAAQKNETAMGTAKIRVRARTGTPCLMERASAR